MAVLELEGGVRLEVPDGLSQEDYGTIVKSYYENQQGTVKQQPQQPTQITTTTLNTNELKI
jgi:hypothetical protein